MQRIAQYSAERIADRMAIQDVMYRWCRAIDRLDYDGIRAVFHPDATDTHGIYNGDIEGLIAWIRERHRTIPFSMHQVSNMLIEFATPDIAVSEAYLRTIQRYPAEAVGALKQLANGCEPDGPSDLWTCSRYVDRFERRGGEWKIAQRVLVQEWKLVTPVPSPVPGNVPGSVIGRRDVDDPFYVLREEWGLAPAR
jgi:hypothetical protein